MKKILLSAFVLGATLTATAAVGNINTQGSCNLSLEYQVPGISVAGTTNRSGVGIGDKFYVNYYSEGIRVYDKTGKLLKTIAPPTVNGTKYYNWVSCNLDRAGHLLVQIDKSTFGAVGGNATAGGGHGFMIIDTETDEIIKDFLPIDPILQDARRFDAMSQVYGNVYETTTVSIWSVASASTITYRFLYNNSTNLGDYPIVWPSNNRPVRTLDSYQNITSGSSHETEELFPSPANKQTTTGYAMQYLFQGQTNFNVAVYANPEYSVTYSAEGKYGNGIRQYTSGSAATQNWYYTPMHSGMSAFNFFTIGGVDYIIYPSGIQNLTGDAFAIAEVSYVSGPATDMSMEGETLVDGKPAGVLKAIYSGSGVAGNTFTLNSYNIEPVEGDANSVYIYVYSNGAPGAKYKFTTGITGEGEGTVLNPFNVERVLDMIGKAINANGKQVYVQGTVTAVSEVNTETGNATYTIETAATASRAASTLTVSGKNLENSDFTSADQLKAGDEVIVYGTINPADARFDGYIYSLNGELSLPEPERDPAVTATLGKVVAQEGYKLEALWTADNISTKGTTNRSGIGINDKFYVNYYADGIHVYNNLGKLQKVIPPTTGYHNWVSCNVDGAGHLLVQLDTNATFDGQCSTNGHHGYMVIDTNTDEVIVDFVPMTLDAEVRFDGMSPVEGDVTQNSTEVWSVISGADYTRCFNYSAINEKPVEGASTTLVTKVDFATASANQTTTGYAMKHQFRGSDISSLAVYANPNTNTYSGMGLPGNSIRKFENSGVSYTPGKWIYTPQHSILPGFNIFKVYGHDYIIYPAGRESAASDAFAIAEISFVDTPITDTSAVGESSLGGDLVARAYAAQADNGGNLYGSNNMTFTSYNVEPVEGDDHSVYIYMYGNGAPGVKYKFTLPANIATSVDEITISEDAPVEYFNLQGLRVAKPTNGVYIKRQGDKVSKVVM